MVTTRKQAYSKSTKENKKLNITLKKTTKMQKKEETEERNDQQPKTEQNGRKYIPINNYFI